MNSKARRSIVAIAIVQFVENLLALPWEHMEQFQKTCSDGFREKI